MPREPSLPDRLKTATRWPAGLLLTSWAYIWRTTVMHRTAVDGTPGRDDAPPIPAAVDPEEIQRPSDGFGPLLHRRYGVRIREARMDAEALIARLGADPNVVAPGTLAHFQKVRGHEGELRVDDEFTVRMPGPWDGPVRVVEVTPRSFRFATLAGHLEAGQIEWSASDDDGMIRFQVQSWARAGDRFSSLLHHRLKMASEVQLHMWASVCERVPRVAGGRITGGIDIDTRTLP